MKYFLKVVPIAAIGLACASAIAEEPTGAPGFDDPKYNVIDDLSDYGGDHSWPTSTKMPERANKMTSSEVEPVEQQVPIDVDFTDSSFNTVDDLSDYGGNYRWPPSKASSDSDGKDLASISEAGE